MKRKLIIDGNAVYEIDEECMLKKRLDEDRKTKEQQRQEASKRKNQAES